MFGGLAVSEGGAELPPEIAHIARDPFDPEFDDDALRAHGPRRTAGIKRLLLDQTLVSGVGNIYADEALWRAQAPRRPAGGAAPAASTYAALLGRGAGGDGRGARCRAAPASTRSTST